MIGNKFDTTTKSALMILVTVMPLLFANAAGAAGAGKIEAAAAAYGLAKDVIGDIGDLASGPSECVRHFYNHSESVWFVRSSSLGQGTNEWYAVDPRDGKYTGKGYDRNIATTIPVYYNGNGGVVEVKGPGYHEMFKVDGCGLDHNGNTGKAVLNDPADGDIQFIN